jgi:hypothetical protein
MNLLGSDYATHLTVRRRKTRASAPRPGPLLAHARRNITLAAPGSLYEMRLLSNFLVAQRAAEYQALERDPVF